MTLNNQFRYNPLTGDLVSSHLGSNTAITNIQERIHSMNQEPTGKEQAVAYLQVLEAMQIVKVVEVEEDGLIQYEVLPDIDEVS